VRIFTIPDTSVYLTATCPFLDRSSPTPTQPRSPLKTLIEDLPETATPPNIATPPPEGPLINDQVNHIIERLQDIILNNDGSLSPNGGPPRQLRSIPPAGVPPPLRPSLRDAAFQRCRRWIYAQRGGAYGHGGMYPPPPHLVVS
jgi:hypothetical protein